MNKADYFTLYEELIKFEDTNVCNICTKKFADPVRIKVCGHYFCEKCLLNCKNKEQCPKCKEHYENYELDYQNTARKVREHLDKLKTILNGIINVRQTEEHHDVTTNKECMIMYEKKVYHVNYINELFKKVNVKGESPLHLACKKKKVQDVMNLLQRGIDINTQDFAGWSPIHEAVESESPQIVEILLQHGALVDIMGEEYTTPLHKAAILKNTEIIKLLIRYGAAKNICDYFGKTPIEYADETDVKEAFKEPFVLTSRVEELFCCKKITAYCYYLDEVYVEKLKSCKSVSISSIFDPKKVTHFFIRKTHKLSVKMLSAMLNGCTIVPQEWVDNILRDDYFINVPEFQYIFIKELNEGIQRATINFLLKLPQLFDGIHFYITGHKSEILVNEIKITTDKLVCLIREGGGKILPRAPTPSTCEKYVNFPYHSNTGTHQSRCCHYIIYEEAKIPQPLYQMPDLKHRSSKWLLDCIISFTIRD